MGSVLLEMMRGSTKLHYNLSGFADVSADIEEFEARGTVPYDLSGSYQTN